MPDSNPFGPAASDIAWESADMPSYDATDSPLLDSLESDLIHGSGEQILGEAYRRRAAGASLDAVRRDLGMAGNGDVSNGILEKALEQGRRVNEFDVSGRISEPRKYFSGWSPQWATKAERDAALAQRGDLRQQQMQHGG